MDLLQVSIPLAAALTAIFTCLWLTLLHHLVPVENREFKDPLPWALRLIWPLVQIVAYYLCALLPLGYLRRVEKRLREHGVGYLMIAEEFLALRLLSALTMVLTGGLLLAAVGEGSLLLIPVLFLLGFFYPDLWVRDIRKRHVDETLRTLPAYLDFISMGVEAGLNFSGALALARKKAPPGPLATEFGVVLRDMRAGMNRAQALKRMAQRLQIQEMTSFVNAVVQAEKMGSSLSQVLKIQADQRRQERFQRAERKAMEAPVKLIGPLVLFVFPTTFVVLAFPIVMKFLAEGML